MQNKGLYVIFVELTKAFDTVSRSVLGKSLSSLAARANSSISLFNSFRCISVELELAGTSQAFFPMENSVKHDCVLSPAPFTLFDDIILRQAAEEMDYD